MGYVLLFFAPFFPSRSDSRHVVCTQTVNDTRGHAVVFVRFVLESLFENNNNNNNNHFLQYTHGICVNERERERKMRMHTRFGRQRIAREAVVCICTTARLMPSMHEADRTALLGQQHQLQNSEWDSWSDRLSLVPRYLVSSPALVRLGTSSPCDSLPHLKCRHYFCMHLLSYAYMQARMHAWTMKRMASGEQRERKQKRQRLLTVTERKRGGKRQWMNINA